ncbi:YceI family protein [Pedobacter sp.]|uniref:YceI family protein n=1 Tax=Pedobacter sp. TaxID=1411316 RepID=UPI0031E09F58
MNKLIFTLTFVLALTGVRAQTLVSKAVTTSFFSSTPIEDIEAISKTGASAINTQTGDILVKISNTTFDFKKKLMQEHFNENYMESDKYPVSTFKGKIIGAVDYTKPGTYQASAKGDLIIHGVAKSYEVPIKVIVANNGVNATTSFWVRMEDHKIKIPRIVIKNIAEAVEVKISVLYQPKK